MTKPWSGRPEEGKAKSRGPMATSKQARALKKHGFRIWARAANPNAPKGKIKAPTIKWMRENLTQAQAGLILSELGYKRKSSSQIAKRPMAEIDNKALMSSVKQEMQRK